MMNRSTRDLLIQSGYRTSAPVKKAKGPSFGSDLLMVVCWACLIPGMLWLGSAMGY